MILRSIILINIFVISTLTHPLAKSDQDILDPIFSLPDLLQTNNAPSLWSLGDSATLEEGRICLTPDTNTKGSLWHKNLYDLVDSVTFELTFRSVGFLGKSTGGLSLWFIQDNSEKGVNLFNGPSVFSGLQLLIDNNGQLGSSISGQLNDGSFSITKENIYSTSFGSCLMAYQDSSVPLIVRLTYDRKENLLKLQIDNKICFQTRKVAFPKGQYHIGITAENQNTVESFEVLKFKVYRGVPEDSLIPNINAMDQPKLVTKIVNKNTGEEEIRETTPMEIKNGLDMKNYDLYKKLDKIEGKILANDINEITTNIYNLFNLQKMQVKRLETMSKTLENFILAFSKENKIHVDSFDDFIKMDEKLEKLLMEQEKIRETTKHQAYIGANGPHVDEIIAKLTLWLAPLIIIMLVMAYYTFRIRQDIVKTKLL